MENTGITRKDTLENACKSVTTMVDYLHSRAKNHNNYKIYTCESRLETWMHNKALYLSNGNKWNDTDDRKRLNPTDDSYPYVNFAICFSFSKSESVAMWMLYGGMQNEGVMIDLKRGDVKKIFETPQINLGWWENDRFNVVATLSKEEFRIALSDVIYCSDPLEVIKRSDTRCDCSDEGLIEALGWRRKAYPWCYENECRLVIEIDKKRISDCRIDTAQIVVADMFYELETAGRIFRSPNSRCGRHLASRLSSRIEWNLCENGCPQKTEKQKEQKP